MSARVKGVRTFKGARREALYHVVDLDPAGFVILPADDLIEPVVGFSARGRYDPSTANPLGALASRDLPGRVAKVRGIRARAARGPEAKAKKRWDALVSAEGDLPSSELGYPSVSDERVSPFVASRWSQTTEGGTACYNYYTPPYAAGTASNYPCGCVATAMSQLMYFHQRPQTGVGTASFSITVDDVPQARSLRGGDGAGGAYAWGTMVADPDSGTPTAARQAIGALCHDAGVSVNMSYKAAGSGTDTLKAVDALMGTFLYTWAVKGYNSGSNLPSAGLNGMVNPNLDSTRPVVLGITGPAGGHAVVCDGYGYQSGTLYHHLNLGWAGSDDAWYNLPNIDSSPAFDTLYKCVYNVFVTGTGEIISGRVLNEAGTPLEGASVTGTRAGGGTYTATTNARGIYALSPVPSNSNYTVSVAKAGYTFPSQPVCTGESVEYNAFSGNVWGADVVGTPLGSVDHFVWDPVYSPQAAGAPFSVTVTAKDGADATVTGFTGTAQLSGWVSSEATVGTGTSSWIYPMRAYYHDARTQVIYLASELGGARRLTALALYVTTLPGQMLGKWTIRLKHTALSSYPASPSWEGSGWTTVYQSNETVSATGWVTFDFSTPFSYDGTSNLMVDFSFNNESYTSNGECRYTNTGQYRSLYYSTDSGYQDPLDWSGTSNPTPTRGTYTPNIKLIGASSVPIVPTTSGSFVGGVWTGNVTVSTEVTGMFLRATDALGHAGDSNTFTVSQPTLAISVSPGSWAIPGVQPAGTTCLTTGATRFTVENTGSVNATLRLRVADEDDLDVWRVGDVVGADQYLLRALFCGDADSPAGGDYAADDSLNTSVQVASTTMFNYGGGSYGIAMTPSASVYLWFRLDLPSTVSEGQPHAITVEVSCQAP